MHDPIRNTAVHEAAHAVIGRAMAQVCGGATIVPDLDDGAAGFAITEDPWITVQYWDDRGRWRDFRSIIIGRIIAYLAGREAEVQILGGSEGGDGDDLFQVACMLDSISWPRPTGDDAADRDVYQARLEKKTRMLVRRHRRIIQALADKLIEKRTLDQREIDNLIASVRAPDAQARAAAA